jgi:protein SCO1/2
MTISRRQLFGAVVASVAAQASAQGLVPQALDVYRLDLRWLDDNARPFALSALAGTPTVITFAYGACRKICSTSFRTLEQVQQLADQRKLALNFVVVGIDPDADKPADWAALRQQRQLNRPNWHFLVGDALAVRRLASRLGVNYWRVGEHMMHDYRITLLAADGHVLRVVDTFDEPARVLLPA